MTNYKPRLQCEMYRECPSEATHLDQKGFIYCEVHGVARRRFYPCRKMRPHEVRRLLTGRTINKY